MEIISVENLLQMNLAIPNYQRPYKWTTKNVSELLDDMDNALEEKKKYPDFKYRVGTVILHEEGSTFNLVDGQQRSLTLLLIRLYLGKRRGEEFRCPLLKMRFSNKISQKNIHDNYAFIEDWYRLKSAEYMEDTIAAFASILEVVVMYTKKLPEAFQLFDSQNTRGKRLYPHDLLKAYHLRAMKDCPYEMKHAVIKWEEEEDYTIRDLFDSYLYPILKWSRGEKCWSFTEDDIHEYKGISSDSPYSYAKRIQKAMPYYQITEQFVEGEDFFNMVSHYLGLITFLKEEINENFKDLDTILNEPEYTWSTGFGYVKNLFYSALLCYYDRFHNFDEQAVRKIFVWAMMLRVDKQRIGYDSINKYAVGENEYCTNPWIPMFQIISRAKKHTEISNLSIHASWRDKVVSDNWSDLHGKLMNLEDNR